MKINNICLENYRIHEKTFVEFDKGINLLLGANGKGKSSILEAIGITLFGSSFRDGNTKGQQQAIRYGQKESLIKIEFCGNDGEIYIIENQIKKSGGFNKLYRKNDENDKIIAKDEITEKLKILVGISGELKDIYENIIVAKQNEFINAFKLKPTERQKLFDKIFNTDIYREIYDGQAKKTLDFYKATLEKEFSFTEGLKQNIEDVQLLKNELSINEKTLLDDKKRLELKISEEKTVKHNIDEILKLKSQFDLEKSQLLNLKKLLQTKEEEIITNSKDIKVSRNSLEIIENNKKSFDNYLELNKTYDGQNKIVDELLEKVKLFNKNQLLQKEMIVTTENIKNQIETNKINIKNEEDKKNQISEEIQVLKEELIKKESINLELKDKIEKMGKNLQEFLVCDNKNTELIQLFKEKKLLFDKKSQDLEKMKKIIAETDETSLELSIKKLKSMEEEKREFTAELNSINTRINDNYEAKKELQNSICPYLQEACKNLQGKNANEFFVVREDKFLEKKKNIELKLTLLESELSKLKDTEFELKNHLKLKIEYTYALSELEKDHSNLILTEKDSEISGLKLEKFIKENGDKDSLTIKLTQYKTKLSDLGINETSKTLKIKENHFEKSNTFIKNYEIKINENLAELTSFENKFNELSKKIRELELFPEKHSIENVKLKNLDLQKKSLQEPYELYLSNEPIAKKLPLLEKLSKELLENKSDLEKELCEKEKMISNLENSLSIKEPLEALKNKETHLKNEIENLNKIIGANENSIKSIFERIEKSNKIKNQIIAKEKIILKLGKKIELTEIFRKNIKDMGTKVSQTLLEEISFWATDNFRKITGKSESVLWSNLENPYEVCLIGDKKISFEQLSGGEQVAVAISLRGAMSSIFTKTNFSIFDEPTNNLDAERKKSLADNIGEILKNLDQSIVVTHDDSFREMAQKVIEL